MKRATVTVLAAVVVSMVAAAPAQAHRLTRGIAERYTREVARVTFERGAGSIQLYDYQWWCSRPTPRPRGGHRHAISCRVYTYSIQSATVGREVETRIQVYFISHRSRRLSSLEGKTYSRDFLFSNPPPDVRTPDQVSPP